MELNYYTDEGSMDGKEGATKNEAIFRESPEVSVVEDR